MNEGDFVYIDYVGRIKDSGKIFDLTIEEVAKNEGIFDPNFKYGPVPVIVGANLTIKGLEDVLKEMKVGEKRTVEITPEKAFGERNPNFIKLIPLSDFRGMEVVPGKYIVLDNGLRGRIVSISGGRVKVDFNHPLAGLVLEYEIELKSEIKEPKEKVKAIIYYYLAPISMDEIDVEIKEKEVEIRIKKEIDVNFTTKKLIFGVITKWIENVEKVKFIDVLEKK